MIEINLNKSTLSHSVWKERPRNRPPAYFLQDKKQKCNTVEYDKKIADNRNDTIQQIAWLRTGVSTT